MRNTNLLAISGMLTLLASPAGRYTDVSRKMVALGTNMTELGRSDAL